MVVDARVEQATGPPIVTGAVDWRVDLGAAVREARLAAGLSQQDLAAALGVRQSSVSQWERGSTAPTTLHLLRLFGLLGAPLVRLLLGEESAVGGLDATSGDTHALTEDGPDPGPCWEVQGAMPGRGHGRALEPEPAADPRAPGSPTTRTTAQERSGQP